MLWILVQNGATERQLQNIWKWSASSRLIWLLLGRRTEITNSLPAKFSCCFHSWHVWPCMMLVLVTKLKLRHQAAGVSPAHPWRKYSYLYGMVKMMHYIDLELLTSPWLRAHSNQYCFLQKDYSCRVSHMSSQKHCHLVLVSNGKPPTPTQSLQKRTDSNLLFLNCSMFLSMFTFSLIYFKTGKQTLSVASWLKLNVE